MSKREKMDPGEKAVSSGVARNLSQMEAHLPKVQSDRGFLFGSAQDDPAGVDPAKPAPGTRYYHDEHESSDGEKSEV